MKILELTNDIIYNVDWALDAMRNHNATGLEDSIGNIHRAVMDLICILADADLGYFQDSIISITNCTAEIFNIFQNNINAYDLLHEDNREFYIRRLEHVRAFLVSLRGFIIGDLPMGVINVMLDTSTSVFLDLMSRFRGYDYISPISLAACLAAVHVSLSLLQASNTSHGLALCT